MRWPHDAPRAAHEAPPGHGSTLTTVITHRSVIPKEEIPVADVIGPRAGSSQRPRPVHVTRDPNRREPHNTSIKHETNARITTVYARFATLLEKDALGSHIAAQADDTEPPVDRLHPQRDGERPIPRQRSDPRPVEVADTKGEPAGSDADRPAFTMTTKVVPDLELAAPLDRINPQVNANVRDDLRPGLITALVTEVVVIDVLADELR